MSMHERIVEIIMLLMSELRANKQLVDIDVSFLAKSGYTQSEISTAFSWLFERLSSGQPLIDPATEQAGSHRVFSEIEKSVIAQEAFGYLIQCRELGVLRNADIETIIERIFAAGFSTVGIPEMKALIAGILFDADHAGTGGTGSIHFNNDDTIH
jgi:uncharacterized protein Smg (DUF494 family)